jgi:sulfane dehydrogenase subunit SoxC
MEREVGIAKGKRVSRRKVLAGAATIISFSVVSRSGEAQEQEQEQKRIPDPTKVQGRPAGELGQRSRFEKPQRIAYRPARTSSHTPLQDLEGIITPSDLHFERHHGGIPEIDPGTYSLLIHGMVERPKIYTLADLKRFPARSMICFLECSGNGGRSYVKEGVRRDMTPQHADGLTSTSEWIGVPLSTLFKEVGVSRDAKWFLAEGMDAAVMNRSVPMSKAWDDAMIAYGQNGEALRPEQGYPARLFLPGLEGSSSVKWIRRIEVADAPFMTREETSKYTDPLPGGKARSFSLVMDAKSIITFPAYPKQLSEEGYWVITGIAWSGRGRIVRVDVSTDGGASWERAELEEPVLPKCHTRFRLPWKWEGGEAVLMSRATDETGYTQPTLEELMAVRGPGTRYHYNHIRAWTVRADGSVVFGADA